MFRIPFLVSVVLLGACSSEPDYEIVRTLHVSAELLAEIRKQPLAAISLRGSQPAARLGGIEDDPWPEGILFMQYGRHFTELGFEGNTMLVEIDGDPANELFFERWKKTRIRRPAGFHDQHYRDLIDYLFLEDDDGRKVLTLYREVPNSANDIGSYEPIVEHWEILIERTELEN